MASYLQNNHLGGGPQTIFGSTQWHYDVVTDEFVVAMPDGSTRRIDAQQVAASQLHAQVMAHQAQMRHAQAMQQAMLNAHWTPSISGQANFIGQNLAAGSVHAPSPPHRKADSAQPDTLGWREWKFDPSSERLKSPSQDTIWQEAELVVPYWDDGEAVRGVSGIHAHLVPKHWKILCAESGEYVQTDDPNRVHGIVERFGKYVLGTEGWRAEWVVIKELMAPSTEVGLKLEQAYPDVIVHYPEDEGEQSCTSETLSKLGKGSRPTSRPKPTPSPSPSPPPSSSQASQQSTLTPGSPAWRAQNGLPPLKSANSSPSSPPAPSPAPLYGSLSSSASNPIRRDFAFNFLESGPIWIGGLVVAAFLMWALA